MEAGFTKGDSSNLPTVDMEMILDFFARNPLFNSPELRNVKAERAGRKEYGDEAVGYVQVKREAGVPKCTIKGKLTPEHKIRKTAYNVIIVINENKQEIVSCECIDCTAAAAGCKHGTALLFWLHRRSEEPSVTSVTSYWKTSALSKVGKSVKSITLKEMCGQRSSAMRSNNTDFLNKYLNSSAAKNSHSLLAQTYMDTTVKKISLHCLGVKFNSEIKNGSAEQFIDFCKENITEDDVNGIQSLTVDQSKSAEWYFSRYGRITASKIFEISNCQTLDGSLVVTIFGSNKFLGTDAMARGLALESRVLEIVEKKYDIKIKKCGIKIKPEFPIFAASPDGISENFCVEVKCPSKDKTICNYIKDGKICKKPYAQVQLQMFLCNKKESLFCIASPDFEYSKEVTILKVLLDEKYCKEIMKKADVFWQKAIYSKLIF